MHFKHKNHLVSSYISLLDRAQEIRDVICRGRPPTGTRDTLTPLSEDTQNAIIAHLDRITALFEQVAQKYIGDEMETMRKRDHISVTKMWASIQLRQLRENMSDIHPAVFEKKYSALAPDEREDLKEMADQILRELEEAQQLV